MRTGQFWRRFIGSGGVAGSLFADELCKEFDFFAAADDEGGALVEGAGFDVEDAAGAVGGEAAGLFREEGHGVGFVEKAELALGVRNGGWVEKDTAFEKCAMEIGDEGADVARRVRAAGGTAAEVVQETLIAGGEAAEIGFVAGIDRTALGHTHVFVAHQVRADRGIEREAVHAVSG